MEYEGFDPPEIHGNVTKFATHMTLKLIAWSQLNFERRVVFNRVVQGLVFGAKGVRVLGVMVPDARV